MRSLDGLERRGADAVDLSARLVESRPCDQLVYPGECEELNWDRKGRVL